MQHYFTSRKRSCCSLALNATAACSKSMPHTLLPNGQQFQRPVGVVLLARHLALVA